MNRKAWIAALAVSPALAALVPSASAALSYNGGTYVQTFDTLPLETFTAATTAPKTAHDISVSTAFNVAGVDGWQGANPTGSGTVTEYRAQNGGTGSGSGRGVLSLGANGSSDRALGTLATSNQINKFGLVLVNNTGNTYTSADISFVGEQWRRGNVPAPNTLGFDYLVSTATANIDSTRFTPVASLDFVAPNTQITTEVALDGNAAANQTAKSATLTDLNWTPGSFLVLRWNGQDQSGQDDGLAIDNVNFVAQVPEPGVISSLAGVGALLALRRRSR